MVLPCSSGEAGGGYNFIPTPAGEMYIAASRRVLDIKKELYKNIAKFHDQGSISIAATSLWGTNAIVKVISQFKRSFPEVAFRLESPMGLPNVLQQIDSEKLDIALAAVPSMDWLGDKRETLFLCQEELTVALPVSHPYIAKNPGHVMSETDMIRLFSQETVLLSKKESANRILIDAVFGKHHAVLPPQFLREITGIKTTLELVSQNLGIGILPVSALDPSAPMRIYSIDPPVFRHNVILFRKHLTVSPAQQTLVRYIQSCIPEKWVYEPNSGAPPA